MTNYYSTVIKSNNNTINSDNTNMNIDSLNELHFWPGSPSIMIINNQNISLTLIEIVCYNPITPENVTLSLGRIALILLYSFTSLAALINNTLVMVVTIKGSETALPMRKHLLNLALVDLLLGVLCVPFSFSDYVLGKR